MGMGYEQHGWPVSTCSRPFWEDLLKPEALSQPVSGGYLIRSHPRPWEQGVAGRLTVSDQVESKIVPVLSFVPQQ